MLQSFLSMLNSYESSFTGSAFVRMPKGSLAGFSAVYISAMRSCIPKTY